MDKDSRIKTEKERLLSLFSGIDENKMEMIEGLIGQASFMLITLEDLQKSINQNGSVDEYKNGKDQYGLKQSAELQAYNQTIKSYTSIMAKLLKIVPDKPIERESIQERYERIRREEDAHRLAFIRSLALDEDTEGGDEYEEAD